MVQLRMWEREGAAHPNEGGRPDASADGAPPSESGRQKAPLRLERRRDGQLWAVRGDEQRAVRVRRLFPWSEVDRHVSLRDAANREFALVGPGDDLDAASRRVLEEAVVAAGFVLEVTRVLELDEEVEIRVWRVETRQGSRTFQTRLDDWPREMPGGGLLIRDVAGDLYLIPDPGSVDIRSRELLWAFVG